MRIAMIGTGYVGLVQALVWLTFGHHVTCIDKDHAKVAALNAGEIPIYEPGLLTLCSRMSAKAGYRFDPG